MEKLEQTLERSSGMMDELTLQLKSAREGMNAAMQARDATVKDLDVSHTELAAAHERLHAVTSDLREAKVCACGKVHACPEWRVVRVGWL